MDLRKFFTELKRRHVYRVATSVFPILQIPAWAIRLVVVLVQADSLDAAMYLGFVQAALGNKEAALRAAAKAFDLRPASVDTVTGTACEEALVRIRAQFGETDAAVLELRRLLKTSYIGPEQITLTPALLRLDPVWEPLRKDSRFQELSNGTKP